MNIDTTKVMEDAFARGEIDTLEHFHEINDMLESKNLSVGEKFTYTTTSGSKFKASSMASQHLMNSLVKSAAQDDMDNLTVRVLIFELVKRYQTLDSLYNALVVKNDRTIEMNKQLHNQLFTAIETYDINAPLHMLEELKGG